MLTWTFIRHGFAQKTAEHLLQAYLAAYLALVADVKSALIYLTIQQTWLVVMRTAGAPAFWHLMTASSLRGVAVTGLLSTGGAMLIMPFAIGHWAALVAVSGLHAFGSAAYYGAFHAGLFRAVGKAAMPGKAAAAFDVSKTAGFLLASAIVFGLTALGATLWMPIMAAVGLMIAAVEVRHLDLGDKDWQGGVWPGWRAFYGAVSPGCLLANFNVEQSFVKSGMPLATSLVNPVLGLVASAGVTAGSVVMTLIGGHAFDRRRPVILLACLAVLLGCGAGYSFLSVQHFAFLTAIFALATTPISLARDARMAAETVAGDSVLAAMAFEAARSAGGLVGNLIMVGCFLGYGTIPTWLPVVGLGLFVVGKWRYAMQGVLRQPIKAAIW